MNIWQARLPGDSQTSVCIQTAYGTCSNAESIRRSEWWPAVWIPCQSPLMLLALGSCFWSEAFGVVPSNLLLRALQGILIQAHMGDLLVVKWTEAFGSAGLICAPPTNTSIPSAVPQRRLHRGSLLEIKPSQPGCPMNQEIMVHPQCEGCSRSMVFSLFLPFYFPFSVSISLRYWQLSLRTPRFRQPRSWLYQEVIPVISRFSPQISASLQSAHAFLSMSSLPPGPSIY